MNKFLRSFIFLLIIVWLGGFLFLPVVAATAFGSLSDTHAAGTVVGKCLRILYYEGIFSGTLVVVLLLAAHRVRAYARNVALPVILALIMLGLTAYSQFWIIPQMEQHRLAAGGAIDAVSTSNQDRIEFNRLHVLSTRVHGAATIVGIVLVILLA